MGAVSPAQALPFASGSVTYDAAGNVMQDAFNNYTYDSQNHMIASQSLSTGSLTCYFYDAYGRRVQKVDAAASCGYPISGGTSLYYVYDIDGNVIDEVSAPSGGTGNWTRQEIYAGGRHLATFSAATGQAYWDFTDWLGTERARASAVTAAVVETCTSLPWGDNLQCTGTDQSPLHFTGKQRDTESGLDNFEARYLASSFGRFISPDLMGGDITDPQTLNRYVYVRDNPLNLIDPSGLEPQSAQNCIYSIYSGATATDCYPSSAGDDQIAQNHGQAQAAPPQVPCPTCKATASQKAPDGCDTSDAACRQSLKQLYPQGGQVSPQKPPQKPPQTPQPKPDCKSVEEQRKAEDEGTKEGAGAMVTDTEYGAAGTAIVGCGLGALGLGGLTDGAGAPLGCVGGTGAALVAGVPFIATTALLHGGYIMLKPYVVNDYNAWKNGCEQ